jgi:shikimate kinase
VNVVLTGFMGAGKSTTGRRLAKLLQLPFVDTDAEIERRHGPIAQIFSTLGEAAFRRIEAAIIAQVSAGGPAVVAVGGGAILDQANRAALRQTSYIVHLAISPRSAYRRVSHRQHRPLLGDKPEFERVAALLGSRTQAYADCDLTLHVDRRSAAETAKIIARWYGDKQSEATRS